MEKKQKRSKTSEVDEGSTKKYKGLVIVGFKLGKKIYAVGDEYITDDEKSIQVLTNKKLIKK